MAMIHVQEYVPWPQTGESFSTAATAVCLGATNVAALAARLYVYLRHRRQLQHFIATISICAAHLFMLSQSGTLVGACHYGWGSAINTLPGYNLHRAERLFFASNILLILVHAFSRASVGFTLLSASTSTPTAKLAVAILCCVPFWAIGSMLGISLNRLSGSSFWQPIEEDLSFTLWAAIFLVGLAIDLSVFACGVRIIAPLQMVMGNKILTIGVFGGGILVNVPLIYGLTYLHQHSSQLTLDPTLYSAPFIHANQASIAVSLWCRVLDAARKLQQDMGYASYGHGSTFASSFGASKRQTSYYGTGTKRSQSQNLSKHKQSRAEDEIELHPVEQWRSHSTFVEGGGMKSEPSWGGIEVSREYGYSRSDHTTQS